MGLTSLCYLWQRDQEELLGEMIAGYINAVLIKVAALGLTPEKHLGKTIEECQAEFSLLVGFSNMSAVWSILTHFPSLEKEVRIKCLR